MRVMKRISAFMLMAFTIFSCSNADDFGLESTEFVYTEQKWELIAMTGSYRGSETIGVDMAWQEYYLFTPDGTFVKSRTIDGEITEANGTFEVLEYEGDTEHYLELTYETGKELVGNCTGNNNELLIYRTSNRISSMWMACDGPGLDYALSKN